ncbi:MAG: RecX family transcriptional regulator [Bernardetiaceae bacterium]|nr:RecX family transcriptional regulator [Bernardetiaceae bacterium]
MSEKLSPKEAFLKATSFCAYQERAPLEVAQKLEEWGIEEQEVVEEIMRLLVSENFLNEARFAEIYAGSKFRIKKWGRLKIKNALRQKQISEGYIRKALGEIPQEDYYETLYTLLEQKNRSLKEPDIFKRKQKILRFGASKGYESELIYEVLREL